MGLMGRSTTAVYLDNVKVPVENVLGEIGSQMTRPVPRGASPKRARRLILRIDVLYEFRIEFLYEHADH